MSGPSGKEAELERNLTKEVETRDTVVKAFDNGNWMYAYGALF